MDFSRILPWIVLSGFVFVILSYVANKYHGKDKTLKDFFQDFIGGSVFVGLLSAIIPDIFPDITSSIPIKSLNIMGALDTVSSIRTAAASSLSLVSNAGGGSNDIELQVGPIP